MINLQADVKFDNLSDRIHRVDHDQLPSHKIQQLQQASNSNHFINQRIDNLNITDPATAKQLQIELASCQDKLSYDIISGNNVNLTQDYYCKSSRSRYQRKMNLM